MTRTARAATAVLGLVALATLAACGVGASPSVRAEPRPSPTVTRGAARTRRASPSATARRSAQNGEQVPIPDPAQVAATAAIDQLTASLPAGGFSVAATDLDTGRSYSTGSTGGMVEGSIAKLDILETLLLQDQDAGAPVSDDDVALATGMIENSDNDDADTLWTQVGQAPAVAAANTRLGLHDTQLGAGMYWGLSTTDAADQLTLLRNLVSTGGPLDPASQQFALGLMRSVEADQRWGVGVVADPGTTFANKNGWLAVDADDDLWLINSLGALTVGGHPVLMAVLTQHDDDFDDGVALVQAIAPAAARALGD